MSGGETGKMQYSTDEAYARLISHKMTVPQRIKVTEI